MNSMLMNQMFMNQMGMNQMGMNGQFNQINQMNMDNTTLNIKNIVKPYEKKIKELEEIIRQKDFEITVLKQKLNINNNNNFMNININPINMNPNINQMDINEAFNINQQLEIKGKKIKLLIKTDGEIFEIFCFERDKISKIREKCNIYGKDLVYNYRILFENSTFSEYGIMGYSIIQAESVKGQNVIFKDASGRIINLALNKKCPLNIALMHYLIISGDPFQLVSLLNNTKRINFSYNANLLNFKDETPIENIFKNTISNVMVTFY